MLLLNVLSKWENQAPPRSHNLNAEGTECGGKLLTVFTKERWQSRKNKERSYKNSEDSTFRNLWVGKCDMSSNYRMNTQTQQTIRWKLESEKNPGIWKEIGLEMYHKIFRRKGMYFFFWETFACYPQIKARTYNLLSKCTKLTNFVTKQIANHNPAS